MNREIIETLENSLKNQYGTNDDVGEVVTGAWDRAFQKVIRCRSLLLSEREEHDVRALPV